MLVYRGSDVPSVVDRATALGATVLGSRVLSSTWFLLGLEVSGDRLLELAAIPGVYSVQPVHEDGGLRGEVSSQVNAGNYGPDWMAFPGYGAWLSSLGLDGDGVVMANVDGGVQDDHPDLAGLGMFGHIDQQFSDGLKQQYLHIVSQGGIAVVRLKSNLHRVLMAGMVHQPFNRRTQSQLV